MTRPTGLVALLVIAAIVGSCGGTTPPGTGLGVPSAGASAAPGASQPGSAGVSQELAEALADPSATRLARVGADFDAAIDAQTGLLKAIGRDEVDRLTDRRSTVTRAALVAAGVDVSQIGASRFSTEPMAAAGPRIAELGMTWVGASVGVPMMLNVIAQQIGQHNGQMPLDPVTDHEERTVGDNRIATDSSAVFRVTLSGSTVTVDADISQTSTATDIAGGTAVGAAAHRTHIRAELKVCPDAQGVAVLTMEVDITSNASGALGAGSLQAHVTGEQRGQVGDDASLQSVTETLDMAYGTAGPNGARQTGSGRRTITTTGASSANPTYTATVQVDDGSMAQDESLKWQNFLQMTVAIASQQAFKTAREQWQGGKCVKVEASRQGGIVDPDEIVHFEAWPTHRIEGTRLDKPIVATLSGAKTVLPAGEEQDPPAPVTYVAPHEEGPAGTVTLKSTSNRGIGLLTLSFTVAPPVVVELEIDSRIHLTKIAGIQANATARAQGRIRLEKIDADEWNGEGTLISTTTNRISGCNTVKVSGQGVYDWVVFNALVSPTTAASDIVVHMDNGTINEAPDPWTLAYCNGTTLTGTLNTWENPFFLVHGPGDRKGMGFEVSGWTLKATPDTWTSGGLIAEAHWGGSCANTKIGIPALPSGIALPPGIAIPSVVDCTDDTTFKLWAVVPSTP